jgi:hypothetical protein
LALASILLATAGSGNASGVGVTLVPSGEANRPEQIRLEFSAPVVIPSETALAAPAKVDASCGEGSGTWIDERTWVYTFDTPVEGGNRCRVDLERSFVAKAGVRDPGVLSFHTGGPVVEDTRPFEYAALDEDSVLVVITSAPVDPATVTPNARVMVEGIATPVALSLFTPDKAAVERAFRYDEFLRERLAAGRALFLRPRTALPAGRKVTLTWGAGILSRAGVPTTKPQEFGFTVRGAFSYAVSCPRENARSGCVPVSPVEVAFNADVSWEQASRVTLVRESVPVGTSTTPAVGADLRRPLKETGLSALSTVARLTFPGPFSPGSRWRVVVPEGFRDDSGRALDDMPSGSATVAIGPVPVLAKFNADFSLVEAADPVLPLQVRAVEPRISLRSKRIRASDFARDPSSAFRWYARLGERRGEKGGEASIFAVSDGAQKRSLDLGARKESPDFAAIDVVGLPLEGKGLHVLEIQSRTLGEKLRENGSPMHVAAGALVTDMSVHLKAGPSSGLVWVTSLSSGAPMAKSRVVAIDCRGRVVSDVRTDASGLARVRVRSGSECEREGRLFWSGVGVVAFSPDGGDVSFTHSQWDQGIERWRFDSEGGRAQQGGVWQESEQPVSATVDRTLLRAGEDLHVALSAWAPRDRPLKSSTLPRVLELRHLGSGDVTELPIGWNPRGYASVVISLPKSLKRGGYQVSTRHTAASSERTPLATVRVEDFKVPTAHAMVELPNLDAWKRGVLGEASVRLEYLSGGSPAGKSLEAALEVVPIDGQSFDAHPGFLFATRPLRAGLRRVDDDALADSAPAPLENADREGKKLTLSAGGDASYPVRVDEPDALFVRAGLEVRYEDASGQRHGAAASREYAPASSVVGIATRDATRIPGPSELEARVVDPAGKPLVGRKVRFAVAPRENYSIRKRILGGFYAYESYLKLGPAKEVCDALTDEKGRARCRWTASEGLWSVEARHVSAEGVSIAAATEIFVPGEKPSWFAGDQSDRMGLVPDRESYRPGDVARVKVESPFVRATALVTLETSEIIDAFVVEFDARRPWIDIPLRGAHAPNVKVSVVLHRGRLPGDRPGPGQVDLGKPSFRLGMAELLVERIEQHLRVEVVADSAEYKVRGKGTLVARVTLPDGRPAPAGTRVTFAGVDEALLELGPNDTFDALAQLSPLRAHSVDTATNEAYVLGRSHFGLKARPSGGGGGRLATRELFDTLVLWKPHLPVDAKGEARTPFTLNDSLSRFRFVAVAVSTLDRRAGHGLTSVATRQDVLVLPRLPLAVREGDVFEAAFVARNTSKIERVLRANLSATGGQTAGVGPQDIRLAPGAEAILAAPVRAEEGGQDASPRAVKVTLSLTDASGAPLDAITSTVPVEPKGRLRPLESSVTPVSNGLETRRRYGLGPTKARRLLATGLAPAGVGDVAKLADYLASYPYACTEQLFSRAVVREDAGAKAAFAAFTAELGARLDDAGLAKNFAPQTGGDPWLTAYILVTSHAWNRPLPDATRQRMLGALRPFASRRAGVKPVSFSTRVLALEALARHGEELSSDEVTIAFTPARLAWEDYTSLLGAFVHGQPRVPAFADSARQLIASLPGRLVRSGARRDLRAEPGLMGARAQAVRARLLVTLLEARDAGLAPKGELDMSLLGDVAATHAVASQDVKSPGTVWSVWGLLLARDFPKPKSSGVGTFNWALSVDGKTVTRGSARPFAARGFSRTFELGAGREAVFTVTHQSQTKSPTPNTAPEVTDPLEAAFLFTHLRTEAPVTSAEHRGLRVACEARTDRAVGDTVDVTFSARAQAPKEWTMVEIPLPPGSQVVGEAWDAASVASPTFVERTALAYRMWFSWLPEGDAKGSVAVRLSSRGTFGVPGCHAEAMREPDVSSTLPDTLWKVR